MGLVQIQSTPYDSQGAVKVFAFGRPVQIQSLPRVAAYRSAHRSRRRGKPDEQICPAAPGRLGMPSIVVPKGHMVALTHFLAHDVPNLLFGTTRFCRSLHGSAEPVRSLLAPRKCYCSTGETLSHSTQRPGLCVRFPRAAAWPPCGVKKIVPVAQCQKVNSGSHGAFAHDAPNLLSGT